MLLLPLSPPALLAGVCCSWHFETTAAGASAAATAPRLFHNARASFALPLPQPGNGEGTRQEAARALSNLSCNNDVSQGCQMVEEGAVPLLVAMMQVGGWGGMAGWLAGWLGGCTAG